jgi:hypothetical protein
VKYLYLLAIAILNSTFSYCQPEFGFRGGLNWASFHVAGTGNSAGSSPALHPYGGVFINNPTSRRISITFGLEYSVKGANYNEGQYSSSDKYTLGYVSVPVHIRFEVSPFFFLETGPSLGVLTTVKVVDPPFIYTNTDSYQSLDFGWDLGFGVFVQKDLGVDVHYLYGFSNIDQSGPEVNNRVFQFGLFYLFRNHKSK